MRHKPWGWLYRLYDRRVLNTLDQSETMPRHVGVITDGNRRWAREFGATAEDGHRRGADKILEFLQWCGEIGVEIVTLYVLSKDNLSRSPHELEVLSGIIGELVERIGESRDYALRIVGNVEGIPASLAHTIDTALATANTHEDDTQSSIMRVNIAVGYGGRQEIVDAVASWLRTQAESGLTCREASEAINETAIADHLYTKGLPDPDLIIRSSGEQRLSGFLMWQSVYSEFYFCEAFWPAFRKTDFLRAVRSYGQRQRRFGR